jgi:EmrB/QacA subfamily drug resistance transporter
MAFMDGSVVNVALPTLQSRFAATAGGIQWVMQSYALFGAALLLPGGAIGDRYGRRRTYVSGIAIFALASALCAAAQSLGQLIAARSVQGVGAALLVPQGLSTLSVSFPEEQRGKAIGTWSAWTSVFAALGPVIGGWLMQAWSWRVIFLLNLPLAAVVFLLSSRIPESRARRGDGSLPRLDRLGATLATLSFAGIIYALSFAPQLGWRSPRVSLSMTAGLVLLAGFLISQNRRANAMMPLSLFRIPAFFVANLLTLLLYGALGGALYVIPFYLIQVRGYAPAEAGAVLLPMVALMFLFSARIGTLVPKVGERVLLAAGSFLAGAGFLAFPLLAGQHSYVTAMLPGVLLLGAGMTLVVAPLTTGVMSSVGENQTGIASAVNNAVSRLAGLIAVSVLSLVLASGFVRAFSARLQQTSLPPAAREEMMSNRARLHDTPIPEGLSAEQRREAVAVLDGAFNAGFREVMLVCAAIGSLSGVVALLLFPSPKRAQAHDRVQSAA